MAGTIRDVEAVMKERYYDDRLFSSSTPSSWSAYLQDGFTFFAEMPKANVVLRDLTDVPLAALPEIVPPQNVAQITDQIPLGPMVAAAIVADPSKRDRRSFLGRLAAAILTGGR